MIEHSVPCVMTTPLKLSLNCIHFCFHGVPPCQPSDSSVPPRIKKGIKITVPLCLLTLFNVSHKAHR